METKILKTIILTTRTTESNDWQQYAKNIQDSLIEITYDNQSYKIMYKRINIQGTSEENKKNIILLDGKKLNNLPIEISNLRNFNNQQDEENRIRIDAFIQLIQKLSQQEEFKLNENLIFAIHWGGGDVDPNREYTENFKRWIEKCYGKINFIITFWTTAAKPPEPDNEINNKLGKANPEITEEDFDSWFDIFKKRTIPLTTRFSLIKHRIMNSFLDLEIDWQGISEVYKKDKNKAKEYLNDVLNNKSENYYQQKLVNLWFYLTGNQDLKIIDEQNQTITSITSLLKKDNLPDKKSIYDLVNNLDESKKKKYFEPLLKHVGLSTNNSIDDKAIIVNYLKSIDNNMVKDEKIRNVKEFIKFDFHKWYLKLGDLLETLKRFV